MITNDIDEAILMADRIVPLTPGPQATLGREFRVGLDRPRDRTQLNFDPGFKKLRNDVTKYMMQVNAEANELKVTDERALPDIDPINVGAA